MHFKMQFLRAEASWRPVEWIPDVRIPGTCYAEYRCSMGGGLPCHRTLQTTCLGDYQSWDWLYSQATWVGQLAFLLNKREVRKQKHTDSSFTLSLNYFGETPHELWKVCEGTCGHRCRTGPRWRFFGACSALRSWERLLFTHDICVIISRWTEWMML